MAATVTISESNGAGQTITADVTNLNMGSTDATSLDSTTYPIAANTNSYEKWVRFCVSNLGGSSKVKNLKVWASAGLGTGATHKTNARESSYGGAQTYATPSATDNSASKGYTQTMPTTTPTNANLGIAGALAGEITTAAPTYSDYLLMQIQTTVSAVAGTSVTMNFQYDEVA